MRRGSAGWMQEAWGNPCRPQLIAAPIYAGGAKCEIDRDAVQALTALGRVFLRHGYIVHTIGGYNCRANTSDPRVRSNHSWGTAVDVNESTNPYNRQRLITDMPRAMVAGVCSVKTLAGVQVWRCGYDWDNNVDTASPPYDPMHFEIYCTRDDLKVGIAQDISSDYSAASSVAVVHAYPVIRQGARGSAVTELQRRLQCGHADGVFGSQTRAAVEQYQMEHGLKVDGVVGAGTWSLLLSGHDVVIAQKAA